MQYEVNHGMTALSDAYQQVHAEAKIELDFRISLLGLGQLAEQAKQQ